MSEVRQDPWGDMPRWSDSDQSGGGAFDGADQSGVAGVPEATPALPRPDDVAPSQGPDACPWCATPAAEGAARCTACGAALAQRESIGDLVIPGLTAVDPALKDLDGRPLHLRGPSPSQGVASGIIVAAAAGGPVGLAILGGVGAIAATEYLAAGGERGKGHERVGETSEAVLQAIERLERGETLPSAADATPRPELEAAGEAAAGDPEARGPEGQQEEATDGRT